MRGLVDWRGRAPHLAIGGLLSFGVVLAAATLSNWPVWQSLPPNDALVRLSFTHSGARSCRDPTPEELAALPRNMRSAQICDRGARSARAGQFGSISWGESAKANLHI